LIVSFGQIGDKEERYCSPALFCFGQFVQR
jgi:hypothetical protein